MASLFVMFSSFFVSAQIDFTFHGIKIFVNNQEESSIFYEKVVGWQSEPYLDNLLRLKTGGWPVYLEEATEPNQAAYPSSARTGLTIQTYKLLPRIDDLRKKGVSLEDSLLSKNGVGISIPFKDPSGNTLSMIEVQVRNYTPFDTLALYNAGVTITNMDKAVDFYERILGFKEWSRNYLPDALPLKHTDESFAFMIHHKKNLSKNTSKYKVHSQMILILETKDLHFAAEYFNQMKVEYLQRGNSLLCKDPEGNYIEIWKTL